MTNPSRSELWVCFVEPPSTVPPDVLVLSFFSPGAEERWAERLGERLVSGREALQDVRPRARRAYLDLIARIGATPCVGGRTLRQALCGAAGVSRWWFLKISEKDCVWDGDPTYSMLLRLFTVRAVADKHGLDRIVVHGGPRGFAQALGVAKRSRTRDAITCAVAVARGLVARLRFAAKGLHRVLVYRSLAWPALPPCDAVLEAHWDWSLGPDDAGRLRERYFADVPARLRARGARVVWLASCEPDAEVWQRGRSLRHMVGAAVPHPDVVLLDSFLTVRDVVVTALNLRYALVVGRFMR